MKTRQPDRWDKHLRVTVPEGKSGDVEVIKFEVPKEPNIEMLRLAWSGRAVEPGMYTKLVRGDALWMSDTPAEKGDHRDCAFEIRFRVGEFLSAGLDSG